MMYKKKILEIKAILENIHLIMIVHCILCPITQLKYIIWFYGSVVGKTNVYVDHKDKIK